MVHLHTALQAQQQHRLGNMMKPPLLGSLSSHTLRRARNCLRCLAQQNPQHTSSASSSTLINQQTSTAASSKASAYTRQWYEQSSLYYSNYPLDRAADARKDEQQVLAWFNAPSTRVTPINGSKILVTQQQLPATADKHNSNSHPTNSSWYSSSSSSDNNKSNSSSTSSVLQPVWITPASELTAAFNPNVPPLFLGLDPDSGAAHFAVQISTDEVDRVASSMAAKWVWARTAGPDMTRTDAALMAVASGLAQWNLDAQYHGATGSSTTPKDGGFSRRCSSSGRVLYPRIDPAVITLVTAGNNNDWCLLGRKKGWPQGRYSTLAGFLELGETLEQALCREVAEEAGVVVDLDTVRYVASQPWPFPRSLMVGFYATAATAAAAAAAANSTGSSSDQPAAAAASATDLLSVEGRIAMLDTGLKPSEVCEVLGDLNNLQPPTSQEDEMEDVRWFHRDWLRCAVQSTASSSWSSEGFMIPGSYSLANKLIMGWLHPAHTLTAANTTAAAAAAVNGSSNNADRSTPTWPGDLIPQVSIDQGTFKYILLRLRDEETGNSKLLVRGAAAAAYHNHILQHTKSKLLRIDPTGRLKLDVLGGGRIEHYADEKAVSVYGYSAAFGPAVHEVTVGLLRKWFPFYEAADITYSYEGY